jgi:hypothetical protein
MRREWAPTQNQFANVVKLLFFFVLTRISGLPLCIELDELTTCKTYPPLHNNSGSDHHPLNRVFLFGEKLSEGNTVPYTSEDPTTGPC